MPASSQRTKQKEPERWELFPLKEMNGQRIRTKKVGAFLDYVDALGQDKYFVQILGDDEESDKYRTIGVSLVAPVVDGFKHVPGEVVSEDDIF